MRLRLILILSVFTLFSCSKNDENRIPDAYVNYSVTLQEFNINAKNGLLLVTNRENIGVAGLIIYKRADNSYAAYDRCSSVNPQQRCAIVPDEPNLTATDPCSGAKFSLFDGSPVKAPATRGLREYQVIITNFTLTVRN
jgi:nitrite reductase/ring-hydroxylating ferredoxin subunit